MNKYKLSFIKEENSCWYIDLPEWTGEHDDLTMVSGSDLLLDYLLLQNNNDDVVDIELVKTSTKLNEYENNQEYFFLERKNMSTDDGATYKVYLNNFEFDIWICPVTLFVLGEYPRYMYIKHLN